MGDFCLLVLPPIVFLPADETRQFVHHHAHRAADGSVALVLIFPAGDLEQLPFRTVVESVAYGLIGSAHTVV